MLLALGTDAGRRRKKQQTEEETRLRTKNLVRKQKIITKFWEYPHWIQRASKDASQKELKKAYRYFFSFKLGPIDWHSNFGAAAIAFTTNFIQRLEIEF